MNATFSFLVNDYRRNDFNSRTAVKSLESPKIGVIGSTYFLQILQNYLPTAELIIQNSPREFLRSNPEELDAFLISAESGSAWTLVYPSFTVAIPRPDVVSLPRAYATQYGDETFVEFLNTWINLKQKDGTIDKLHRYWIEGSVEYERQRRWSLIDHWFDN
jgi:hypothetical protein